MQPLRREPPVRRPSRDPAPSRTAYKFQRLWLTPLFRSLLRTGLPAFALAFGALWLISDVERTEALAEKLVEIRTSIEQRPEFQVKLMAIEGGSDELVEDIRDVLPIDFPVSSFDLDVGQMHEVINGLDAVATADISVQPGGILQVTLVERTPAVVWQTRDVLELLDAEGHRVAPIEARVGHSELPLIAGEGGDKAVPEALEMIAVLEPFSRRFVGLQRMSGRRWDVVFTNDLRVLLPEEAPLATLQRVLAVNEAHDLFARDIVSVDMRLPDRPTVRLRNHAVGELFRIRELSMNGTAE